MGEGREGLGAAMGLVRARPGELRARPTPRCPTVWADPRSRRESGGTMYARMYARGVNDETAAGDRRSTWARAVACAAGSSCSSRRRRRAAFGLALALSCVVSLSEARAASGGAVEREQAAAAVRSTALYAPMAPLRWPSALSAALADEAPLAELRRDTGYAVGPQRILGGTSALPADHPGWSAVALVGDKPASDGSGPSLCSGTLVAPNLVVTAGHCVQLGAAGAVVFGRDVAHPEKVLRVVERRSYSRELWDFPNFDIAWVRFEGEAPASARVARVLPAFAALRGGTPATLVGYGRTDDPDAFGVRQGTRLAVTTSVRELLDDSRWRSLIVMGPTYRRGACQGDSGGPAFVKVGNDWLLAGASAGMNPTLTPSMKCRSGHSLYTFVGAYVRWIEETSGVNLGGDLP